MSTVSSRLGYGRIDRDYNSLVPFNIALLSLSLGGAIELFNLMSHTDKTSITNKIASNNVTPEAFYSVLHVIKGLRNNVSHYRFLLNKTFDSKGRSNFITIYMIKNMYGIIYDSRKYNKFIGQINYEVDRISID